MYLRNHYTPKLRLILDFFDHFGYFAMTFQGFFYIKRNLTKLRL